MAGFEGKEPLALRIFRRAGRTALETAEGETLEGRGVISALRQETGEAGGKRHPLGTLSRPLYRFTGWIPDPKRLAGGVLVQGEARYRVLDERTVSLGERQVCVRALLEKEEEYESQ